LEIRNLDPIIRVETGQSLTSRPNVSAQLQLESLRRSRQEVKIRRHVGRLILEMPGEEQRIVNDMHNTTFVKSIIYENKSPVNYDW
jgi:hypothetical protein